MAGRPQAQIGWPVLPILHHNLMDLTHTHYGPKLDPALGKEVRAEIQILPLHFRGLWATRILSLWVYPGKLRAWAWDSRYPGATPIGLPFTWAVHKEGILGSRVPGSGPGFHIGIRIGGRGPDHFVGTLPADPKSELSVPLHWDPIWGLLGLSGPAASIPRNNN